MIPGPTLIMKAPGCTKPVKFSTIVSGNTCYAKHWTDGKVEAPMLPDQPWLRKSPSEEVLFWSDQCECMGEITFSDGENEKQEWRALDFAEEPSEEDYFGALSTGIADTDEKMRYLRMRLWWSGNDHVRRGTSQQLSASHFPNLEALAAMLSDSDPNERLMKAEILRELSRFDEATSLLDFKFPQDRLDVVKRIRQLAAAKQTRVATITQERPTIALRF